MSKTIFSELEYQYNRRVSGDIGCGQKYFIFHHIIDAKIFCHLHLPLPFLIPGPLSRDITSNIPVLNIADNWPQFTSGPSMLSGNTSGVQSQYGMWMGASMSNIPTNQNCSMPYLRAAGYSVPSSTSPTSQTSGVMLNGSSPSYEQCDISNFLPPSRDLSRNSSWSPLTPPPI